MSIGSNKGGSSTQQTQSSSGFNQSFGSALNTTQEGYLNNLWGGAQNLANQGAGQAAGYAGYNAALAGNQQGQGYLNQGAGAVGGALGQLGQGQQAFNTLGNLQNPGVDPMMGVYADQIGQQFNRQVMPALQGQAILGGGLGSSRAGIAQGLAASDAQRNIQNFGAQLYGQGQDRALQAAGAQGNLANQFAQTGLQGAGMYGQLGQATQQGAMNNLAAGQFGMGIPWYAQQQFAGLLGSPIVEDLGGIGSTNSMGVSSGSSKSRGFSFGL